MLNRFRTIFSCMLPSNLCQVSCMCLFVKSMCSQLMARLLVDSVNKYIIIGNFALMIILNLLFRKSIHLIVAIFNNWFMFYGIVVYIIITNKCVFLCVMLGFFSNEVAQFGWISIERYKAFKIKATVVYR